MVYNIKAVAEMAERSNAHDSKSCYAGMYTRVQIPFSAPQKEIDNHVYLFWLKQNQKKYGYTYTAKGYGSYGGNGGINIWRKYY